MIDFEREVIPFKNLMESIAFGYLGDYDLVQDVVQKVLIKLWEKRETIYSGENMNAFISTVIKNACIDELRKSKDEQLDDNLEYIHSVDLKISDELLQGLGDYDRAIIRMKYEEGLTLRRISEILSKSENTIQTQYKRALKKLRDNARGDTCNI